VKIPASSGDRLRANQPARVSVRSPRGVQSRSKTRLWANAGGCQEFSIDGGCGSPELVPLLFRGAGGCQGHGTRKMRQRGNKPVQTLGDRNTKFLTAQANAGTDVWRPEHQILFGPPTPSPCAASPLAGASRLQLIAPRHSSAQCKRRAVRTRLRSPSASRLPLPLTPHPPPHSPPRL
jgi:hypothetical protein